MQVVFNGLVLFGISYVHSKATGKHEFLFPRRAACKYRLAEETPGQLAVQGCANKATSYPVCGLPECSYNSLTEERQANLLCVLMDII